MLLNKSMKNFLVPATLGVLGFCYVVGLQILEPQYIGWLYGRFDPIQHYLGWDFFRRSDWTMPIGLSPSFGVDISSSIVYADSIPLMAIIFKGFDHFLPSTFQYFGFWLLICFVLQAYFGWKLAVIYFDSIPLRLGITILFVISPQLLWRLNTHAGVHNALASHFLILAGIFLVLRRANNYRFFWWTALFLSSLMINFYFLLITSLLWAADSVDRCISKSLSVKDGFKDLFLLSVIVLFFGWQVGYFAIATSSVDIWGYGFFRFNLMAPIDSYGLSTFIPDVKLPSTWGEGYGYFGLGVLIGCVLAIPYFLIYARSVKSFILKNPALLFVLALFLILSVTNNIGIGSQNFVIDLPEVVLKILGITHSAARFFWPIYYFLIIFVVYAIYNVYSKKLSIAIILSLAIIQLIDLNPLMRSIHAEYARDLTSIYEDAVLKDPLWKEAAKKYKKLILIPAMNQPLHWETFALLASEYDLPTNSIFTARIDSSKIDIANKKLETSIELGKLDGDSLYVLQDRFVLPVLASANSSSPMLRLDGFNLFLPGWYDCDSCSRLPSKSLLTLKDFRINAGQELVISSHNNKSAFYLGSGWSWLESWGVWSNAEEAYIFIPTPNEIHGGINLNLQAFVVHQKLSEQVIDIYINGNKEPAKSVRFKNSLPTNIQVPFDGGAYPGRVIKIKISIKYPKSPKSLKIGNEDERRLGIGLSGVSIY